METADGREKGNVLFMQESGHQTDPEDTGSLVSHLMLEEEF